ncbi:MAG: YidC/Oxa1 family membrane protein insertase [Candidatus Chisholmbacteria bacterium]|nr:YidC/Oxa1 family membrane protein insertase [Candidatus Chisholmbacteria bacterium]
MLQLYTTFIYQPFFNLLLAIYYGLLQIPGLPYADIGVALIIFTIALRFILLPITLASDRTEDERRQIEAAIEKIRHEHRHDPVAQKRLIRKLFISSPRVIGAEIVNFLIQGLIFLMLFRIFSKGLLGADFHLIYDFMPDIPRPLNLSFLGIYDLTHPNFTLNIIQSMVIFAVELASTLTSPFPTSRRDIIRLQLILPIASFIIFMTLPAGKKLFIITTLSFSLIFILLKTLRRFLRGRFKPTATTAIPA